MQPRHILAWVSVLAAAGGVAGAHADAPATPVATTRVVTQHAPVRSVQSVFHIEKSENKNQVHYAVKVDAQCRPVGKRPVYGYWRNLENGDKDVSKLLGHEMPAYGLTDPRAIRLSDAGGEIQIALRGFPDRALTIQTFKAKGGCGARAFTRIGKQQAVLRSIYVKIGFLFSVDYAIVRGVRVPDGQPIQEKVDD